MTGHTGFKGAWLSLWLQSLGAEVTGLSRGPGAAGGFYRLAEVGAGMREELAADVRDGAAVAAALRASGAELVFHLAGQPLLRRALREPRLTYEVNLMGTVNVLQALRGSPSRAAVMVTSDRCYEDAGAGARPYAEDDPLGGADPYSSSKACAELAISAYRRSFLQDAGAPRVASARAGNAIGGGDLGADRLLPDALRAVEGARRLRVRNPRAERAWQHVLNPLSGYLLLAQRLFGSAAAARAWNFGPPPGGSRPVSWIVARLAQLWDGALSWELDPGPHPPEAQRVALDSTAARTELGWTPPWGLQEALAATVAWQRGALAGRDMRALSLAQLDAFAAQGAVGDTLACPAACEAG